jgi:hypothetical protein
MYATIEPLRGDAVRLIVYPKSDDLSVRIIHDFPRRDMMDRCIEKCLFDRKVVDVQT